MTLVLGTSGSPCMLLSLERSMLLSLERSMLLSLEKSKGLL